LFEQAFKNIDNVLRREAGCTTELDYAEQTSWLLFLKYLDGLEEERAAVARLEGRKHRHILDPEYRWAAWASPKDAGGKFDHNAGLVGDDLRDFVDGKLFPYLQGFKQRAEGPRTIEYKIGEIFGELKNKITSGYNMREIIEHVDELRFNSQAEKHELSELYEARIRDMGNAGRNGGEYYTPRPLIRAIINVVKPKLCETIYDGACGSAGFLCESYEYLTRTYPKRSTEEDERLQKDTFFGQEKKSLAYVLGTMNMVLHGIEAPNLLHVNTLETNLNDIQPKDQVDVVLANPPFGGRERKELQQNFRIRTSETAFLFLQHFMRKLKAGGSAGIVIKNTFLSNMDNAAVSLRRELLDTCDLHTVLDCPSGTFQGAGVKTVVLFFEKGKPTTKTWYYQLDPGRTLGKTTPLNDADMAEFVELQSTFADSAKSWTVKTVDVDQTTYDLSVKNPNNGGAEAHRTPAEIIGEIEGLDAESAVLLEKVKALV
jgi:type I restriction enzyme M protein